MVLKCNRYPQCTCYTLFTLDTIHSLSEKFNYEARGSHEKTKFSGKFFNWNFNFLNILYNEHHNSYWLGVIYVYVISSCRSCYRNVP